MPLYDLRPALPCVGGGIHPANAARIIADIGLDVMLAVGGAIQGHPDGAVAGGRAMRQAIDAVFNRYHSKVEGHLDSLHPVLLSTMDSARHEIEAVLNPQQLVSFHEWIRAERHREDPVQHSVFPH